MLVVYTFAFKIVLRVPNGELRLLHHGRPPALGFLRDAVTASTQAIVGNAGLIRKVYFPREILPIASVLFSFTQLLLALAVFLPALMLNSGIDPSWKMLLVLPVLLLHLLFTVGLAFALAAVTVHFRDVAHLTEVLLPLLFWATPIVYPIDMVPGRSRAGSGSARSRCSPSCTRTSSSGPTCRSGPLVAPVLAWTCRDGRAGIPRLPPTRPTLAEEV